MSIAMFFVTIVLIALSFSAGLALSGYYHARANQEQKEALQRQYSRLMAGADADDPVQPYVPRQRFSASQEFIDRLHSNGSATMKQS